MFQHTATASGRAHRLRPLIIPAAIAAPAASAGPAASTGTAPTAAGNPHGDPHLVSMFDGRTLTGWTQAKAGEWSVVPPNGGHWDYRPGHNGGSGEFTQLPHTKIPISTWSQCEIIADQATGVARMACCPLAPGAATCKATEVLDFKGSEGGPRRPTGYPGP